MSFLKSLLPSAPAGGMTEGVMGFAPVARAAAPTANAAATGLGKLLGVDPGRISSIADSVGKGMNMIAAGGGASQGYAAPELPQQELPRNHLQLLDPSVIQALIQRFGGAAR